jgi:hypothetical protein
VEGKWRCLSRGTFDLTWALGPVLAWHGTGLGMGSRTCPPSKGVVELLKEAIVLLGATSCAFRNVGILLSGNILPNDWARTRGQTGLSISDASYDGGWWSSRCIGDLRRGGHPSEGYLYYLGVNPFVHMDLWIRASCVV